MEKFWWRVGLSCRNIVCQKSSKSHFLGRKYKRSNKNMSSSVAIDIVDQGKPLIKSNGVVVPESGIGLFSTFSVAGDPSTITSPVQDSKYSEVPRVILSYIYMFVFGLASAFVVIVAHDRTPNREQYQPLPDMILDNVPNLTWAFHTCEVIATVMFVMFVLLLCFHTQRFVILRRLFIIYGSMLLMRCFSLLLTSLPIPNKQMQCDPMLNDTVWSKFQRAGEVYLKFGMASQGVRTCGDYMFSGHTVFITLLNFVLNEYTPFILLHIVSWILALTAMSFIMLGHAHYSIDVVIAFFISALYFYYYHSVANHHKPGSHDLNSPHSSSCFTRFCITRRQPLILIPFYGYLERKTGGAPVSHEFESPITAVLRKVRAIRHRIIVGKSRLV